jgi:hypothetical protein
MERKLGEIFTYNGKIYQVVKGFSCKGCAFIKNGCCDLVNELLGPCDYTKRTDKTNVIFKEPVWIVSWGDEDGSWWEVNRVPDFYKNQFKKLEDDTKADMEG